MKLWSLYRPLGGGELTPQFLRSIACDAICCDFDPRVKLVFISCMFVCQCVCVFVQCVCVCTCSVSVVVLRVCVCVCLWVYVCVCGCMCVFVGVCVLCVGMFACVYVYICHLVWGGGIFLHTCGNTT